MAVKYLAPTRFVEIHGQSCDLRINPLIVVLSAPFDFYALRLTQ